MGEDLIDDLYGYSLNGQLSQNEINNSGKKNQKGIFSKLIAKCRPIY